MKTGKNPDILKRKYRQVIYFTIVAVLILFCSMIVSYQDALFSVNGKVTHFDENISRATIKLYKNNSLENTVYSKVNGSFTLTLDVDNDYIISIEKQGFVSQKFEVSTQLSGEQVTSIKQSSVILKCDMLEFMEGLNISQFKEPVGKFIFSKEQGKIIENVAYKNKVKPKISKVREELYKLKTAAYESEIEASKDLAREGNIKEAFNKYRESYYKYYKDEKVKIKDDTKDTTTEPGSQEQDIDKSDLQADVITEELADRGEIPREDTLKASIARMENNLKKLEASGSEEQIASLLSDLADAYFKDDHLDKAINYYERSLELEERQGDNEAVAKIQSEMAIAYFDSGKYNMTLDLFQQSLQIKEDLGDKEGVAATLSDIATVYENTFQYEDAIEYYEKAIQANEKLDNKSEMSFLFNDLGNLYFEQGEYDNTVEYFEKSIEINKDKGKEEEVAKSLNNLGVVYYELGEYDKALLFYQDALEKGEDQGDKEGIAVALNNIGNVNFDWEKYKQALNYYKQSLEIRQDIGSIRGEAASLHNIANVYVKLNKIDAAIENYLKSNELAIMGNYTDLQSKNYRALYKTYYKANNCKEALKYNEMYNDTRLALSDEGEGQISDMRRTGTEKDIRISTLKRALEKQKLLTKFESDRRKQEVEIKNLEIRRNEAIANKRKIVSYASIGGLIGVLFFSFFLYRQYSQKKKTNIELRDKNKQILAQKKSITDSIKYASRIQNAVLPRQHLLEKLLPDYFILFKPRDIVSGDFYWITNKGSKTIIAVADCTGHGVPGAFMSMLGYAFLNEIVNRSSLKSAGEVLNELRDKVIQSLHQTGESFEESKDGMDMVLCIIDFSNQTLQYSGAFNPLYIVSNSELQIIKGDKMPISIHEKVEEPFTTHEVKFNKGDTLYMFSDGFPDQFGGIDYKKFMIKRFQRLLLDISGHSMEKQKELLDVQFEEWRGDVQQMDDVMVMGVKV